MSTPRLIRVLSISDDDMVRSTRELVLRKDGYEIVSVSSSELLPVPVIRSFDAAVICHSVPADRAMGMADRLRRYKPDIRLLRVNPQLCRAEPFHDFDSEVSAGPGALLKGVKELLARNAARSASVSPESKGRDEYCGPFSIAPWINPTTLVRM